jgi:hypothetical protein
MIDKQYFVSLRTLVLGYAKGFLTMFIKKRRIAPEQQVL